MKFALFLLFLVGLSSCVKEKRILLSDPDIVNSRLGTLETQVQSLIQTNQQQTEEIQQQAQKILQLEQENIQLRTAASFDRGSTYTRWGRTVCPGNSAQLVYRGYAAGQSYNYGGKYNGGPADTLCLPHETDLSNTSLTANWSPIFGTEYESNVFAHDSQDNDMPCAVCRNGNTTSSLMIPGRRSCYPGWVKEYQGILASGHTNYRPSSYICVDSAPEYLDSGKRDENGHVIYPVKTQCGPLPCPPYHNDMLVECVVCSK